MEPVRIAFKGRGAVSNPAGRYERDARAPVDDGWAPDPDDVDPPGPATVVTPDAARSIIARNTSPDIGFDASIQGSPFNRTDR